MRRIEDIALELIMAKHNKEVFKSENAPEGVIEYFKTLIRQLEVELDAYEGE